LVVVGIAPTADARDLEGSFAFTSARTCTVASKPFTNDASGVPTIIPNVSPAPPGFFFRQEATDTGITTFNENGHGKNTVRSRTMNITNTTPGDGNSILSITDSSDTFTFTVNEDNTVDLNIGQVTFSTVLGGGTGNTGTVTPRLSRIQLSKDGNTFVTVNRRAIEQETVIINVPGTPPTTITQFRLCNRSTTGERIRNDDRHDD